MGVLNNLKAMADKMIAAEGQAVVVYFVNNTGNSYDPSTGTNTSDSPIGINSRAVLLNYALESTGKTTYNNSLIEKDDRECYLSWKADFPRDPSPASDYLVDSSGTQWAIVTVKHNNPSGSCEIMYNLQLRR